MKAPTLVIHADGLIAAKARQKRGRCIFCEERLIGRIAANGRKPLYICGSSDCRAAYVRAYSRDRRQS